LNKTIFLVRYYLSNYVFTRLLSFRFSAIVKEQTNAWSEVFASHSKKKDWLIVCNGPSLKKEDLEALAHLPSIASNKISLLFDKTSWRPSLYTISDALLTFKLKAKHYEDFPLVLSPDYIHSMIRSSDKLAWKTYWREGGPDALGATKGIHDPIEVGFFRQNTITVSQIQLAMWLGAKNIYVIGCDHSYAEERHANSAKLDHGSVSNHFDPRYRVKDEIVNSAAIEKMESDYEFVEQLAKKNNVKIKNISRKTALSTFELSSVEQTLIDTNANRQELQ
jgi:hypothetical protein